MLLLLLLPLLLFLLVQLQVVWSETANLVSCLML
jgi:hypothetical protein